MVVFPLNKTQVWLTVAVLLLSSSVRPLSCYPQTQEDEDLTEAEEKLDNGEDQEWDHDDDEEGSEEEEEEDKDDTKPITYCTTVGRGCGIMDNPDGLPCCTNQYGDFYECGMYNGLNCIRIKDEEIQNELKKKKLEEIMKMKPGEIKNENPEEMKKRERLCDWYCKKSLNERAGFLFVTRYCPC